MLRALRGVGQMMRHKNNQADFFMPAPPSPPATENELMKRADNLAGTPIGRLAEKNHLQLPASKKHGKGLVGQMIETILGANAGNQPHPDFEFLGVELKTLPVSPQGIVTETTFVCSIDLKHGFENTWHDSRVFNKLKRVLWFPVEDDNNKDWTALRLGQPFLWSPSPEQERILSDDWHDHMNLIAEGLSDGISARRGQVLQIRPKAANSQVRRVAHDAGGDTFIAKPIGFYLRRQFTQDLLEQAMA